MHLIPVRRNIRLWAGTFLHFVVFVSCSGLVKALREMWFSDRLSLVNCLHLLIVWAGPLFFN